MAKLSREQFIAAIAPAVLLVRQEGSPIFPSVRIAQSILETGGVIHAWNNLGGIKVGTGSRNAYWQGEAVVKGTWEYVDNRSIETQAAFRAYRSIYHYYKDQDLFLSAPRYDRVRSAGTPERQAQMFQASGYATDPAYASKLMTLIRQHNLTRYDELGKPQPKPPAFQSDSIVPIIYQGQVLAGGYLKDGVTWIPARRIGEGLGAIIGWTGSKVTANGQELDTILSQSTGYVKIRDLAGILSLGVSWDDQAKAVILE
ncbi:glucosaminidase domain-containing protein [Paenibacillus soyae]|uniref:Glucosaminidase domain-containing protein n=1 Tax=Paenibacillus soyae TaxID=2969249 RepID=A0A9X2S902_9BACL|nr:glucosaminidase domain-containing protein [Paenibacillus soyae]MCR2804949.1 glucosaminidase domain-containing protein [Paenibacillus soyae]